MKAAVVTKEATVKANLNWDIDNNGSSVARVICPVCHSLKSCHPQIADYAHEIVSLECPDCSTELLALNANDESVIKRNGKWEVL